MSQFITYMNVFEDTENYHNSAHSSNADVTKNDTIWLVQCILGNSSRARTLPANKFATVLKISTNST